MLLRLKEIGRVIVLGTIAPTEVLFEAIEKLETLTDTPLLALFAKFEHASDYSVWHRKRCDCPACHDLFGFQVVTAHGTLDISRRAECNARCSTRTHGVGDVGVLASFDIGAPSGTAVCSIVHAKTRDNLTWRKLCGGTMV